MLSAPIRASRSSEVTTEFENGQHIQSRTSSQATLVRSNLRADAPAFVPTFDGVDKVYDAGESDVCHKINKAWRSLTVQEKQAIVEQRIANSQTCSSGFSPAYEWAPRAPASIYADPQGNIINPRNRWSRGRDSKASHLRLGRAPMPSIGSLPDHGWTIGSAQPGWWYGWRGGDGREIAFTGNGPDAEKDPNSPVNFRAYMPATPIDGVEVSSKQASPSPLEGKGQGFGLSRMEGCGNFEVVQAVEHIGLEGSMVGWCQTCLNCN